MRRGARAVNHSVSLDLKLLAVVAAEDYMSAPPPVSGLF
jgi:hypothetical protein